MDEHDSPDLRARGGASSPSGPVVAGRYRVERLIARGGMAAVFLAEHIALRRRVALKILHPPPDAEEAGNYPQRFKLEAETLATLDHPNIVTLYDYGGAEEGRFYLAMEYIEGPRYTDLLADGTLDAERTIRLLLQVCAALRYAHRRGVIHRDLKPSNLLIRTDAEGMEQLKVVDFGLVKVAEVDQSLTREGLVLGSPHCMAPEQVRGSTEIDHRADIYAIGVLLFRSLTGTYPFHGATSTSTMVAHLSEPIPTFAAVAPALRVHPRLEAIVRRCLAKRPADRYPDVKPLMDDLAACLPGEVATVPVSGGVLLDGITVAVGREMPTERPAWRFPTAGGTSIPTTAFAQFQLTATGVHASIGVGEEPYDLEGPFDGTADCQTAFWTYVTDADGDGVSDAHPNANFPSNIKDFWPRVYLRNVADPRYVSEAIPLPAAFGIGLPAVNTPTPATTLDVLFSGAALRVDEDGTSELISDTTLIPKGAWAVTVVQFTGQTWTLPNELAFEASTDASFDPISQAGVLTLE